MKNNKVWTMKNVLPLREIDLFVKSCPFHEKQTPFPHFVKYNNILQYFTHFFMK